MSKQPAVTMDDLEETLMFLGSGDALGGAAWVCRATGKVVWQSDDIDESEPLPEDIDDESRYVPIPNTHDLGLGKPRALEFARVHLPDCYAQVREMFSRRGAYARFKDFLERRESLESWYEWEQEQTREALRGWCGDSGIKLIE